MFAGLDEVVQFLDVFKFNDSHIEYLKKQMPQAEPEFFEWLRGIDSKSLTVHGIPDGTIVFGKQPLLSIEGPIAIVQLIETPVLNLLNFATLVCTNASRMNIKSGEKVKCIEFGLRRAQGPNGALTATKYSFMGGFVGTSNVYAGMLYDIPISGTIAHSFIMSFDDETNIDSHCHIKGTNVLTRAKEFREELKWTNTNDSELCSFVSFACSYPDKFLALIDTFGTIKSGCKNFLCVSLVLSELGYQSIGIRLDSGNLAILSQEVRNLFIETGKKYDHDYSKLTIVASDGINEDKIRQLNADDHQIDIFGIGTNLVTCEAQPALGMVYKLVEIEGKPKIKISEEKEKVLLPGRKKVFRVYENETPSFDIMLHEDEEDLISANELTAYHPFDDGVIVSVKSPTRIDKLTQKLYENGQVSFKTKTIHEKRTEVLEQIEVFDHAVVKSDEKTYEVYLSKK